MKQIILKSFIFIFLALFFNACEKKDSNDPAKVHWDRDMCDRCKMVISEKQHAVQIKNQKTGEIYKFDDIGCVSLWFKEENISWQDNATIWVADIKTSKWLDAKTAFYTTNNITPMGYGFGAHEKKEDIKTNEEIIDFEEMSKRTLKIGR